MISSGSCNLPYVHTRMQFQHIENTNIETNSLLDSGATHSFVQLDFLPIEVRQEIKNFTSNPFQTQNKLGNMNLKDIKRKQKG